MNVAAQGVTNGDAKRKASVALKTFFNIMAKWEVKSDLQMVLLGNPSQGTFYKWKRGDACSLTQDTLERISYIMGIYKALGIIFPTRTQADAWPKKANKAFGGQSALDYMTRGEMTHLMEMRRYVDTQQG